MGRKYTHEKVKHFIEVESNSGCELLSEEYYNMHTKMEMQCSCGNNFEVSFDSFKGKNKRQCNDCGWKNAIRPTRLSYEDVKDFIEVENGYKLISKNYSNAHAKLIVRCKSNHEYITTYDRFKDGKRCPYCSGRKVLKGFNDMWTTNPKLADMLLSRKIGYEYTQHSGEMVDWKCPDCDEIIKNKRIIDISRRGLSCPKCSDGFKYPEKVMYHLLKQLNLNFEWQKTFKWLNDKRYDFYIPSLNMIIETHGRQHYEEGTRGRSLKEEQENDIFKYEKAIENGIIRYITIDCRISELELIKKNVISSELTEYLLLGSIDWGVIEEKSRSNLTKEICEKWNEKGLTISDLATYFSVDRSTVTKYLKVGDRLGWCKYNATRNHLETLKNNHLKMRRPIVQLDINLKFINKFDSASNANKSANLKTSSSIINCCKGKCKTAGGFKWMYLEDYEKQFGEIHNDQQVS